MLKGGCGHCARTHLAASWGFVMDTPRRLTRQFVCRSQPVILLLGIVPIVLLVTVLQSRM